MGVLNRPVLTVGGYLCHFDQEKNPVTQEAYQSRQEENNHMSSHLYSGRSMGGAWEAWVALAPPNSE